MDPLGWSEEQAALLRAGRLNALDYEHILEELEDMGREQKLALQSLLRQILIHLLKLELSPATAPRGKWVDERVELRAQAQRPDSNTRLAWRTTQEISSAGPGNRIAVVRQRPSSAHGGEQVEIPEQCPYSWSNAWISISSRPAPETPATNSGVASHLDDIPAAGPGRAHQGKATADPHGGKRQDPAARSESAVSRLRRSQRSWRIAFHTRSRERYPLRSAAQGAPPRRDR